MTAIERPAALTEVMGADPLADETGTSLWQGAFQRLRRNPSAILGAIIVALFVLVAIFAPLIAPYEPATSEWISEVTPSDVPGPSEGPPARPGLLRFRPASPSWSTGPGCPW